jgi:hypothetical protein
VKSLVWKAQRARMMRPLELGDRATREIRNLVEHALQAAGVSRGAYRMDFRGATSGRPGAGPVPTAGGARESAGGGVVFFDADDEALRSRLFPLPERYETEAGNALSHRVSVLGHDYSLGGSIDWHRDYRLGRSCPIRYSSLIDVKDPEFEESVRWVWYLNRHRHLAALGRAYFVTRKAEYAQEVVNQLRSWVEQNPPAVGVNWATPLEVALRLLSWCWALFAVRDFEGFTQETQKMVVGSVGLQLRHLSRNLSTHSSANNHLIAQAAALFVSGNTFGGLAGSSAWAERGAGILWREIMRQTFADGVNKEQSVHYHSFVAELAALALLFARRNGIRVPAGVNERFGRMCDFLLAVSGADGAAPAIGDSDDQPAFLPESPKHFLDGLTACAAYLLDREDLAVPMDEVPLEAALFLGREGLAAVDAMAKRPGGGPRRAGGFGSRAFSEGGYYVLGSGTPGFDTSCVVDCGELGLGSTAAHGHADCLSLTVKANGKHVLIDPGTFTYHSQPQWRSYFRSTAAHNTVAVDGRSQSQMLGPFVWGRRARPRLEDVTLESYYDFVTASHDGYSSLKDPVRHRRVVVFVKPGTVIVVDVLSGKAWHEYEQNFHFGGPAALHKDEGCVAVRTGANGGEALLFSPAVSAGTAVLAEGETRPILGWNSPRFWERTPCQCLSVRGRFRGVTILEACVVTGATQGNRPRVTFPALGQQGRLFSVLRTETESFVETSLVNLGSGPAGDEVLQSDASYVCMREYPAGGLEVFGRNVGRLVRRGEVLMEATARMPFVRIRMEKDALRYEARGEGTVSVRSGDARSVVSSLPGIKWEKDGEFLRILADT